MTKRLRLKPFLTEMGAETLVPPEYTNFEEWVLALQAELMEWQQKSSRAALELVEQDGKIRKLQVQVACLTAAANTWRIAFEECRELRSTPAVE